VTSTALRKSTYLGQNTGQLFYERFSISLGKLAVVDQLRRRVRRVVGVRVHFEDTFQLYRGRKAIVATAAFVFKITIGD